MRESGAALFWRRICWWLISLNWISQIYTFTNILKGAWATPPSTSITPFSSQSEPAAVILSSSLNKLKTFWQQQVLLFGAFAKSACLLNKTYFANRYWIIVNILHFAKKFGLRNLFFFLASEVDQMLFCGSCSPSSAWILMHHSSLSWSWCKSTFTKATTWDQLTRLCNRQILHRILILEWTTLLGWNHI